MRLLEIRNWIYEGICVFEKGEVDGWGATWEQVTALSNKSMLGEKSYFLLGKLQGEQFYRRNGSFEGRFVFFSDC